MNKFFMCLICITGITNSLNAGFDQSLERWEIDCMYELGSGCNLAGRMYERGSNVTWDGKNNHELSMPKNVKKALTLYKKGCDYGHQGACENYAKLFSNSKTHTLSKKNYAVSHQGSKIIYKILGKRPCKIVFDKRANTPKHTCKKFTNSRGIKIFCTQSKKVCKTESEIIDAINL